MKRRDFIALLGGTATWPFAARPQTKAPDKIGYLHPVSIGVQSHTLGILRPVWQKLGYVEGENLFLRSAAEDLSRLPTLVAELVGLGASVLIVAGPAAVKATVQATKTVPIVAIDLETDPVRAGLAASVNRPGGNVTGLFLDQPSLAGKWLQLLREAVPNIERVALIWDPTTGPDQLNAAKAAAWAMRLEPFVLELRTS